MTDDTKINEGKLPSGTSSLPRPVTHTRDVPFQLVKDVVRSSKNMTQASRTLSQQAGFSERAWRYAIFKMEVQGVLSPTEFTSPNPRHINTVNKARAKHGVEKIKVKKVPPSKKFAEDNVMVTVHMRAESNGLGARGFHPINLEASMSRILPRNYNWFMVSDMINDLRARILNTPNYGNLRDYLDMNDDGQYINGVEVEELSMTHHTDGEIDIPLKPKRSRSG